MLFKQWDSFGLQLIADFVLLIEFLFEVGLFIFVVDLDLVEFFSLLVLDLSHLEHLLWDAVVEVGLFIFELLCFGLEFFEVFFDGVGVDCLLFDHSVTAGDSGNESVNLIFGHFALLDMIFLMFQVFS